MSSKSSQIQGSNKVKPKVNDPFVKDCPLTFNEDDLVELHDDAEGHGKANVTKWICRGVWRTFLLRKMLSSLGYFAYVSNIFDEMNPYIDEEDLEMMLFEVNSNYPFVRYGRLRESRCGKGAVFYDEKGVPRHYLYNYPPFYSIYKKKCRGESEEKSQGGNLDQNFVIQFGDGQDLEEC